MNDHAHDSIPDDNCFGSSAAASPASPSWICWCGRDWPRAAPIAARSQAAAFPRQGQGRHLDLLLRRRQPHGHVRSQARAAQAPGRGDDRRRRCRRSRRASRRADAFALGVQELRPVRHGGLVELFPHVAEHADDLALIRSMYSAQQRSWSRALSDEHRHHARRPPQRGQLGHLRAGHRERKSARLHRLHRLPRRPDRRRAQLGQRLHARGLSGHAVPFHGDADRRSATARGDGPPSGSGAGSACWATSTKSTSSSNPLDSELSARIGSYELAFRMQTHATEAIDIEQGIGRDAQALRARRGAHRSISAGRR